MMDNEHLDYRNAKEWVGFWTPELSEHHIELLA